ncbi:MAG: aspartate-semialdehyde dehydrogenase [Bacteroidales bacterium]|nr:aspartate-semialdehyde dehydrogenase [Bacteroidales bacterium]MBN2756112.1 aspartate-semialdehyde dehydrogenase [Bacteroidales bacterium]
MKLAIVGVTGMVGNVILRVLEEKKFPVSTLLPVASKKSIGKEINFKNINYQVIDIKDAVYQKPDIAIFSAGSQISIDWAEKFANNGCFVIDNSSAWRMDETKKLIIPEINANILTVNDKIIANPNCSTIQMLMAIAPLHRKYKIKRLVISTYQSVSGTGMKAIQQLEDEANGIISEKVYPHQIYQNCLPHCDVFTENGYTKEEMKLINETHKILNDETIRITATAVRVPVTGGHSESVNIEFENKFEIEDIKNILSKTDGVVLKDDIKNNIYPMPIDAKCKNEVFVGRIRRDFSNPNSLNLWIVADNLRKGAATNTIQIAEYLIKTNLIGK